MKIISDLNKISKISFKNKNENDSFKIFLYDKFKDNPKDLINIVNEQATLFSKEIDCQKCGRCCTGFKVQVITKDMRRLAMFLQMDEDKFVKKYCIQENKRVLLNETPCPFFINDKCSVYNVRPEVCRMYPYLDSAYLNENFDKIDINQFIEESEFCPILFNSLENIKSMLNFTFKNKPEENSNIKITAPFEKKNLIINRNKILEMALNKQHEYKNLILFLKKIDKKNHFELISRIHFLAKEYSKIIDCTECGACCLQTITVSRNDRLRIADLLNVSEEEFEINLTEKKQSLGYILKNNGICPFLDENNKCDIYESRPDLCRRFPFLDSKDILHPGYKLDVEKFIGKRMILCPIVFNIVEQLKKDTDFNKNDG